MAVAERIRPTSIFISYRRDDSRPFALLLKYELEKHLQFVRIFLDTSDIHPGDPFPDAIRTSIADADVVLALIAGTWMPRRGEPPREGDDWVEEELTLALAAGKLIIPVRFSETIDFSDFDIPAGIRRVTRNAFATLAHENWSSSVEQLIQSLVDKLQLKRHRTKNQYPVPSPSKGRTQPFTDEMIHQIIAYEDLAGWYVDNFNDPAKRCLVKEFRFDDFDGAFAFMKRVAEFCSVIEHHPIWDNLYNNVKIVLSTFDAQERVTFYDISLALFINKEYHRQTSRLV
jgi:4a-hydroxytetrahydrobiopterin dehydratase